ncbi:nucleoside-diphosphate sugar epimerase [Natronococcus pandeyae]|uniref:Nucleoside-diphosphate sugar epimerase n=1 Tax=Natronococcus pandeyae TaxID=2055836 RepID=A0A8J8Q7X1_9EURY|nr:NAD(P)-dependent oxidoreductase [Natronococcus pandeyae]TYL38895.1 nucleoside-diphosphate sugar epimerase [Natronococcus pandeyae]
MELRNSTVLVTGGAGFIGSHLCRALVEADADVVVVDDLSTGRAPLVSSEGPVEPIDVRSDTLSSTIIDVSPDAIVHLAAIHYVPYCDEHPRETFEVNVLGTRQLLEAARRVPDLQKFVFASSAAVYPPRAEANEESARLDPVDVYGETKLVGEDLVRLFAADTDVPTALARLFNVYGPNETNSHLIPAILMQIRDGRREVELGNLTPRRDFVYVDDVVRAIIAMLTDFDGDCRPFNVGTGTTHSVREVVEVTSRALDDDIAITQDEGRTRESDRPHLEADVSRIRDELGWTPDVTFQEGIRRILSSGRITAGEELSPGADD